MPPRKVNIVEAADRQISTEFEPYIVSDVNNSQVKVAKFGAAFDWHSHANEDEGFFVLRGRIAIDFRDGTVELEEGDFIVVPRTVEHRPRSLTDKPTVMLFEPSSILNTGDAESKYTLDNLKRLEPS
jgi:mannose-6-phosphate isomerase-like protein (cupin superfamily)